MRRDPKRQGGEVLAFQERPARRRPAETGEGGERGTLLLFTGVRYERPAEPAIEPERAAAVGDRRLGA